MTNCNYITDLKSGKIDRSNFNSNIKFLDETGFINEDTSILEIGCGAGRLINHLTQKGHNAIGFDISRSLINEGRVRYPNATMFLASAMALPFRDSSFEIVMSFDVFEHISDPHTHLSEVRRVLKPKGVYLFQTPNMLTNLPFEIIKNKSFTHHKSYHCSLQTFWSLKRLLKTHGFKYRFVKIPVMNEFMEQKIEKVFGRIGGVLLRIVNLDKLPLLLRTNFYVFGEKK